MSVVLGATVLALVASGCVARVSVSSTGTEGNQPSERILGVTNDGRYVLFVSDADNLVHRGLERGEGRLPSRHDDEHDHASRRRTEWLTARGGCRATGP